MGAAAFSGFFTSILKFCFIQLSLFSLFLALTVKSKLPVSGGKVLCRVTFPFPSKAEWLIQSGSPVISYSGLGTPSISINSWLSIPVYMVALVAD